jgi:hypothetical protein
MVSMKNYMLQFVGIYILCSAAIILIPLFLNFEIPSSMGIVTLIAATAPVMQSFVKREQRVPTKAERRNFATLSTLVSLLLSAVLILGSLALYQVGPLEAIAALQIPAWVIALIILISGLLSWLVIYFFSGFMARQTMKQIEKAKLK